jgi:hypothetical protein
MGVDLSASFQRFDEDISLGEPQVSRLRTAATAVGEFLANAYGMPVDNTFMQGSFPNGTAVEPVEGGEYDLDLVTVCVGGGVTANEALDTLEAHFRADGRFRDRVRRKKPCVRLEYAEDDVGKFHVDVVPAFPTEHPSPPLEVPRRDEGWHETAPAEYTAWCHANGPLFARTVRALKRWRDEQQSVRTAIKSIVLQVLVAKCMPQVLDDADRLARTLTALHQYLSPLPAPPVVSNPVLPTENLASRWTQEGFQSFVKELGEAVEWAEVARSTDDAVEAANAWREILGEEFPATAPQQLGLTLGDVSHAQTPEERGWRVALDPRYQVAVTATQQRGKRGQSRRPYATNGGLVFAGQKLHFRAHVVAPNHVSVWWQVANTGAHARQRDGLRGDIFKGKDLRSRPLENEAENWEHTAFMGVHLIRAMLVRSDVVVAMSDWFRVNVYAKGVIFRV